MAKKPLYPHVPKGKLGAFICGQCGLRFHSGEELNKHLAKEHPEAFASVARAEEIEIERYHGIIVGVGGISTKTLSLPDWDLSYVQYPPGQMEEYRAAMQKAHVRIARVTDMRIYFVQ